MELVSIIITTYKRESAIVERAVRSVARQSYSNKEILVVDDSPADYPYRNDIRELVSKYQSECNIAYYPHELNLGACAARNTGIKNSKGTFICFLDDDDEYDLLKVEKQVQFLSKDQSIAMVYCDCVVIDDETGERKRMDKKLYRGKVYESLLEKNFVGTTSFPLIRRECLINLGGFDTELPACQDYDMWLRICKEYSVDYIDEPLVLYHNHSGEQITKNPEKRIKGLLRLVNKNEDYLKEHKRLWSIFHVKIIPEYLRAKKYREAEQLFKQCICNYPWLLKTYIMIFGRIAKERLLHSGS